MKNELMINPKEFGIEKKQADELLGNLPQLKEERSILENQYKEIISLDIEDSETSKKARELRLKIRDNRTKGINQWHKVTKDYFLKGGQFVDAIKRKEIEINERMESNLEEIEKHAEIKEQKRIEELKSKRIKELEIYSDFVPFGIDLGIISDEEYKKVFNGAKMQFDAQQEAERKAEEERLKEEQKQKLITENRNELLPWSQWINEFEKIDFEKANTSEIIKEAKSVKEKAEKEAERIRKENEKLQKEREEERKKQAELEAKRKKEEERLQKEHDEKLRLEREKRQALELAEKKRKQEEERVKKEREEAELKAKKESERLAKAPIKNQLSRWVNEFELPTTTVENDLKNEITEKFDSFKKWSLKQVENL